MRFRFFCWLCTWLCLQISLSHTVIADTVSDAGAGAPVSVTDAIVLDIVREIPVTGTVSSPAKAALSVATEGLVTAVAVDVGARVNRGDALLALDDQLTALQWRSAVALQQRASNEAKDAQRRLQDARGLITQRSISESAVLDLETEVEVDSAALQQAVSDAEYYRALLERHHLTAPFAGVISEKNVEVGEWISPGKTAFTLVALEHLRLDFAIAEDYLPLITTSTQVRYQLDALGDNRHFESHIDTMVPVMNESTQTFYARAKIQDNHEHIKPGMSVSAVLTVPAHRRGVVVPTDAIQRYPDGRVVVWTVEDKDGHKSAVENVVQVGEQFRNRMEVITGINAGMTVVIRGNESLISGQQVRLIEATQDN